MVVGKYVYLVILSHLKLFKDDSLSTLRFVCLDLTWSVECESILFVTNHIFYEAFQVLFLTAPLIFTATKLFCHP